MSRAVCWSAAGLATAIHRGSSLYRKTPRPQGREELGRLRAVPVGGQPCVVQYAVAARVPTKTPEDGDLSAERKNNGDSRGRLPGAKIRTA